MACYPKSPFLLLAAVGSASATLNKTEVWDMMQANPDSFWELMAEMPNSTWEMMEKKLNPAVPEGALELAGLNSDCHAWRQTGQCSGSGSREPWNDKSCNSYISSGWSGWCECGGGRAEIVGCGHASFTCAQACRRQYYHVNTCHSWRQTGQCSAHGSREPWNDKSCSAVIASGWSGWCDCADGITAAVGCGHAQFTCSQMCHRGDGLLALGEQEKPKEETWSMSTVAMAAAVGAMSGAGVFTALMSRRQKSEVLLSEEVVA